MSSRAVKMGPGTNVRPVEERRSTDLQKEGMRPQPRFFASLDVLGWQSIVSNYHGRLFELHHKYEQLKHGMNIASEDISIGRNSAGTITTYIMKVQHLIVSDTIWLWADDDEASGLALFRACSEIACKALELGLPLRGAIVFGEIVIDTASQIYFGPAINLAVAAEHNQNWVGIGVHDSCRDSASCGHHWGSTWFEGEVAEYAVPMKRCAPKLTHALLWHQRLCDPISKLEMLRNSAPKDKQHYYASAIAFVEQHPIVSR